MGDSENYNLLCEEVWEALSSMSEGGLQESAALKAHLSRCRACAKDRRFIESLSATLSNSESAVPNASLRDSILQATVYRSRWSQRFALGPRIPQLAFGGAITALVLIVLGLGTTPNVSPGSSAVSDPSSALVGIPAQTDYEPAEQRQLPSESIRNATPVKVAFHIPDNQYQRMPNSTESRHRREIAPNLPVGTVATPPSHGVPMVSETERPTPAADLSVEGPRIERDSLQPPVKPESRREPVHVARAEERPLPEPEVTEMEASPASAGPSSYTMEAKSTLDPGAVASLADLKRSLQRESEEEPPASSNFRMNDRRELRLAVHTSRF